LEDAIQPVDGGDDVGGIDGDGDQVAWLEKG
jgi:hypothetical protein